MQPAFGQDIDRRFARARELWQRDQPDQAERILRSLAERSPAHVETGFLRAEIARSRGQLTAAARVILDLCRICDFDHATSLRGARFIQECQRHDLAAQLCDAALARHDTDAELLALAGDIARESGDFIRAIEFYRGALTAGVNLNQSYVLGALAQITRYTDRFHSDFELLDRHFHNAAFSPRSRASAGFGLAKAYSDVGDAAAAADTLRQANAMVRATAPWSSSQWNEFVQTRLNARVTHVDTHGSAKFIPVFVVGLPRTGTTLTATLLGDLNGVRDRGELRVLRFIANRLIEGDHTGQTTVIEEAAGLYLSQVRQDDAPAIWYLDQDPLNFRYLDIAAAMFPQARIIHCDRSRRDTALSLWRQDFAHPEAGFVYDFSDIATYAEGHDRLMQHWRQTLRVPIHELDYETLVSDPAQTVRKLCDFIGMPFETAPQATRQPINSSSVWQARQPIYSTSVGRWRKYLPYVPELVQFPE